MNVIEQYDANNNYYPIFCNDSSQLAGVVFGTVDNNIYKTKVDWGDSTTSNQTKGTGITKNYSPNYTGRIKVYNNRLKVTNLLFRLLITPIDSVVSKNLDIDSSILDYFPNTETIEFNHYAYNSVDPKLKGKVTGEWASKCGNKLKILNLGACDYPSTNATFNFSLIPANSVLQELYLGNLYNVPNAQVIISGSVSNLPATCKIAHLGGDRSSTSNTVSGVIPNTVEEFSRIGRNTISGNIANLNPNLIELNVQGSNTLTGMLVQFSKCLSFQVSGNNTISGNLSNLSSVTNTISIAGQNTISGSIPANLVCSRLVISGLSNLTGNIPVLSSITNEFNIQGGNTLTGVVNLPNCTSVTLGGQNTVSSLNLPKVLNISIVGQNKVSGDLYSQVNPLLSGSLIIGGQNTVSSISGIFTKATIVNITGNNTISGDFLNKFPVAVVMFIIGNNTVNAYTSRSYSGLIMQGINIQGLATLTTAMVDQIFIDLARDVTTWAGGRIIILKGNCQPPSSDSLAARNSLVLKGVTISTNI